MEKTQTSNRVEGKQTLAYLIPFAGMFAGAAAVRLVIMSGIISGVRARLLELPLGQALAGADNLTLAGGLLGLALATAGVAVRLKRKREKAAAERIEEQGEKH